MTIPELEFFMILIVIFSIKLLKNKWVNKSNLFKKLQDLNRLSLATNVRIIFFQRKNRDKTQLQPDVLLVKTMVEVRVKNFLTNSPSSTTYSEKKTFPDSKQ